MSNETLCQPGVSKFINLISDHHTSLTSFNPHHRFGVECVNECSTTWKEHPSLHVGKEEESGDSAKPPQSCTAHHIAGMAGEQQDK